MWGNSRRRLPGWALLGRVMVFVSSQLRSETPIQHSLLSVKLCRAGRPGREGWEVVEDEGEKRERQREMETDREEERCRKTRRERTADDETKTNRRGEIQSVQRWVPPCVEYRALRLSLRPVPMSWTLGSPAPRHRWRVAGGSLGPRPAPRFNSSRGCSGAARVKTRRLAE